MGWSPQELPQATLAARLARLQGAMVRDGFDAYLIYTNLVRPSAVCWLTGFTPYWIDSILLVRRDGAPVLATALSKRVADWIRATSWLDEIVNTPKPGTAVGQRLAAADARRVGVLELDAFPAGFHDDLVAAAPTAELVEATATFAAGRRTLDTAERGLIERADAIALAALAEIDVTRSEHAGELAGRVEKHARLAAAEEAYIAVAPDLATDRRLIRVSGPIPLGPLFAVRASVAYKGSWVRRTRTFAKDADAGRVVARADTWLDEVARSLVADRSLSAQLAARVTSLPGTTLKSFLAESSVGSYPLEVVASPRSSGKDAPTAGSFLVLTVELSIGGTPWLGAAPAFVATPVP
jgi:hypothetical protein